MVPPAPPDHHGAPVEAAQQVRAVAFRAEFVDRVLDDRRVRELERERDGRSLEDARSDEAAHHGRRDAADGRRGGQDDETAALEEHFVIRAFRRIATIHWYSFF